MEEDVMGNNEDTAGIDKDNKRDSLGKDEYEGNDEEKNIEKLEAITNQTTKKSMKGNTRKRKANENPEGKGEIKQVLKKVASEGKVNEYCGNLAHKGDNDQDSKATEMGNLVSTCDDESSKKVTPGDEAKMSPEKLSSEGRDIPEQVDSMGMIFMCNSETKKDCYGYKVVGLPANKREMVEKVYKGMKLFLYDVDLKLMYGIYKAAENGGFSIEPKAFKSQFPSQVRFSIVDDCLPLAEEKFREVIKTNYYTKTKFDCKLTSEQVNNLCKLFISASKASGIQLKSETSTMDKTSLTKGRHMDKSRQPEHVRQTKWMEVPRYHSHPHMLERDVVTTPLLPLAWPQNSLPLLAGQSHNRTLENGVYGCDTLTHNRDTSREGRLVEPHDSYRRDKLLNPDIYRGEALAVHYDYPRQDGLVEHREYQLVNVEAGLQDVVNHHPYALYSENLSSQDPVYSPHPTYNPPPGLRPEYRLGSLLNEYSSTRGIPPAYHSSPNSLPASHFHQPVYSQDPVYSPHPTYNPPPGLRPEYRLGSLLNEYSSTRGIPPAYHSSPNSLPASHFHQPVYSQDPVYSPHPTYNPPPGLRPEYRLGSLLNEYSSTRGMPPEYHSSPNSLPAFHYHQPIYSQDPVYSPHPMYNPPPGLRPEYRLGSLLTEYSSTRGMPPEYHSSPNSLPAFHYHQPVYSQDHLYSPHPTYNPPPGLRPEYRLGSLLSEYSSTRGMPPEYHSSPNSLPAFHYHQPVYSQDHLYSPHPTYNPPPGLRPEYRLGSLLSGYSSTRGMPPEYHSSPNSLPAFHYHQPVYRY
ncbi:uncharacterized protein [Solanum tuberosum]|uniref:DCD domain-containing protein n=3 Tax=Solanum TaxID=4107 RepID=M1CZK1_SOLTU|nr:PREDICTED: uncharacterized protein LOC102597223 isoform X1 [Solanum tuberosum]